jgi:hypothetical protein
MPVHVTAWSVICDDIAQIQARPSRASESGMFRGLRGTYSP